MGAPRSKYEMGSTGDSRLRVAQHVLCTNEPTRGEIARCLAAGEKLGVQVPDCADYENSELVGRALSDLGNEHLALNVHSKFSTPYNEESLRQQLEATTRDLGVVPKLMYLHVPDFNADYVSMRRGSCVVQVIARLIHERKMKAWGLTNHNIDDVRTIFELCEELQPHGLAVKPKVVQVMHNILCDDDEVETLVQICRKHDACVYVYNPLAGGLLTGKYDLDVLAHQSELIPHGRFRNEINGSMYCARYCTPSILEAVREMRDSSADMVLGELAMRWLVHHSAIDASKGDRVVVGFSTINQLEEVLLWVSLGELTQAQVSAIKATRRRRILGKDTPSRERTPAALPLPFSLNLGAESISCIPAGPPRGIAIVLTEMGKECRNGAQRCFPFYLRRRFLCVALTTTDCGGVDLSTFRAPQSNIEDDLGVIATIVSAATTEVLPRTLDWALQVAREKGMTDHDAPVMVHGSSIGGMSALCFAGRDKRVTHCVVNSGTPDWTRVFHLTPSQTSKFRDTNDLYKKFAPINRATDFGKERGDVPPPVIVAFHSLRDHIVDYSPWPNFVANLRAHSHGSCPTQVGLHELRIILSAHNHDGHDYYIESVISGMLGEGEESHKHSMSTMQHPAIVTQFSENSFAYYRSLRDWRVLGWRIGPLAQLVWRLTTSHHLFNKYAAYIPGFVKRRFEAVSAANEWVVVR